MRFHPEVIRTLFRPMWLGLIVASTLLAAGGGLWLGLQQDQGETATTYVFGSRVGFDAPLDELEDHIADIVNSLEFLPVFERIENRTLLSAEDDYTLDISILENTQSIVSVEVQTNRSGEADRIARIVAEEMVRFVLEGVDESIATDQTELERDLAVIIDDQARLVALAGNVDPTRAELSIEREIAAIRSGLNDDPVGAVEGDLRAQLDNVAPLADQYRQTEVLVDQLEGQLANTVVQRTEIEAATAAVSEEWYRSITPVEPTSNVPVAIAMAFAAAFPALVASTVLVALNLNRRLVVRDRAHKTGTHTRAAAA